jgi:myo-inositol-1(or 4)-monophosphatase
LTRVATAPRPRRRNLIVVTSSHASDAHHGGESRTPRRKRHQSRRARPGPAHGHREGPKDFVSEIDRGAEAAIVDTILKSYPDHAILAEEGTNKGNNPDSEYVWIIDPLDGTTNFLHGFPQYCVSIALAHKDVVQQGVIFDPVRNDLFTATRGRGAFLNDRRIRVSKRQHLRDCLIGTGFPFRDGSYLDTYLQMMKAMITQTAGLRRPGAAALDLAYVAAGFYDGFWEVGLNPWDVAAGSLLVLEAGGLIGDLAGEGNYLFGGQVIAASPKIFAQMVTTLGPYRQHMERDRAAATAGAKG